MEKFCFLTYITVRNDTNEKTMYAAVENFLLIFLFIFLSLGDGLVKSTLRILVFCDKTEYNFSEKKEN